MRGADGDRYRMPVPNRSAFWSTRWAKCSSLPDGDREPNPINLDRKLARVSAGVFRLDGQLLVVLDVDRVLDLGVEAAAA